MIALLQIHFIRVVYVYIIIMAQKPAVGGRGDLYKLGRRVFPRARVSREF